MTYRMNKYTDRQGKDKYSISRRLAFFWWVKWPATYNYGLHVVGISFPMCCWIASVKLDTEVGCIFSIVFTFFAAAGLVPHAAWVDTWKWGYEIDRYDEGKTTFKEVLRILSELKGENRIVVDPLDEARRLEADEFDDKLIEGPKNV